MKPKKIGGLGRSGPWIWERDNYSNRDETFDNNPDDSYVSEELNDLERQRVRSEIARNRTEIERNRLEIEKIQNEINQGRSQVTERTITYAEANKSSDLTWEINSDRNSSQRINRKSIQEYDRKRREEGNRVLIILFVVVFLVLLGKFVLHLY